MWSSGRMMGTRSSAIPAMSVSRGAGIGTTPGARPPRAAAHHEEQEDQDQRAAQRPGDGVDEKQERVGPVGLDLPAHPEAHAGRAEGARYHRKLSLPSWRTARTITRSN